MKTEVPIDKFYSYMDQPLRFWSRFVIVGLVAFIPLGFTSPLWRISMDAPQYPDGLYMDIHAHKIEGGNDGQHIQEINTLNHYIGMPPIVPADFADLDWMPFALGILALLALRTATIGNVRSLVDLCVLVFYILGFMGARFVYKLYVYGHDLDPEAPFTVEPFMPVVLGTKQIANFTTHSLPQEGAVYVSIFALGVAFLMVYHLVMGRRDAKRIIAEERARRGASTPTPARAA